MTRPEILLTGGLALFTLLLALISLAVGQVYVPLDVLFSDDPRAAIVFGLRLPRALIAILVGSALGASGAVLQGYVRNPLADAGVMGISPMAAFGAVMTLYLGAAVEWPWMLPVAAITGAVLGVLFLLALAGASSSVTTFIMAGMILSTVASAGVALALTLSPSPWAVDEIIHWLLGSVSDRSIVDVRLAAPFILVGLVLMFLTRRALDALTLGDKGARALGINLDRTRLLLVASVGLCVGAAVAVSGVIGFVGLITPHLMRPLVGSKPGSLILPSAMGGAALVLASDIAVRLIPSQNEVKLGAAMAVLGGPFFLALLISRRRRMA